VRQRLRAGSGSLRTPLICNLGIFRLHLRLGAVLNLTFKRQNYQLHTASLSGSIGKDFAYHASGHEFESRLKWNLSNFPHHLWLLLSDDRGMAKWFWAHYNHEVHFSSAVKAKKGPQVVTSLLNQRRNSYSYYSKTKTMHSDHLCLQLGMHNFFIRDKDSNSIVDIRVSHGVFWFFANFEVCTYSGFTD